MAHNFNLLWSGCVLERKKIGRECINFSLKYDSTPICFSFLFHIHTQKKVLKI